jgi:hypothetical protein
VIQQGPKRWWKHQQQWTMMTAFDGGSDERQEGDSKGNRENLVFLWLIVIFFFE